MTIPFDPVIFGIPVNIHLILEYTAFIVAFRYYVVLRKRSKDEISSERRLSIILGCVVGALIGSRVVAFLENPVMPTGAIEWLSLLNNKTIMGGLFGGLLGVELTKKRLGEKRRSGDLFTLPIILGIAIGRAGCFLSGIKESTYGVQTDFFLGMDLGDGLHRHPTAMYEVIFLVILFVLILYYRRRDSLPSGMQFQLFMILYFTFRFFIEFIKPNEFSVMGLTSIQWLCLLCLVYYSTTILQFIRYAGKKVHLL